MSSSQSLPHILLCNDDGFRAPGVQQLARRLMTFVRVTMVAPEGPRSGFSSAITPTLPLRLKHRHHETGLTIYSVEGTPADCVKLALGTIFLEEDRPVLIVSGINHGSNDGISVHYSGTIGAAREAAIVGIPALATSLDDTAEQPDFSDALDYTERIVRWMLSTPQPSHTLLSLNVPKHKPLGLNVCRQGVSRFVNEWMPSVNGRGHQVYWLQGEQQTPMEGTGETDVEMLRAGYATLTPLTLDTTDYRRLEELKTFQL